MAGFLIDVANAAVHLGNVALMLGREFGTSAAPWTSFYINLSYAGAMLTLRSDGLSAGYFSKRLEP